MMSKKAKAVTMESGKRKSAIARATVRPGEGVVRVNSHLLKWLMPEAARDKIMEPLILSEGLAKEYNIDVEVKGGGFMGQAEAISMAIARSLVKLSKGSVLRQIYTDYDRTMLSGDSRRKESKKFGGPGARRRKQKSYR
ncbi:30S ribosomal protein S9 [Candidatus Bathyarchaeota archaeon]|nr:30S ribosomal protein S9 [Candidatus Bathyarchaeota archaeon]